MAVSLGWPETLMKYTLAFLPSLFLPHQTFTHPLSVLPATYNPSELVWNSWMAPTLSPTAQRCLNNWPW